MTPKADPKAFMCDVNSIRWDPTGPTPSALLGASRNVRPSAVFFNRGQQSWPLIAKNRPAPSGGCYATAVPAGTTPPPGSSQLKQGFSVRVKNLYGLPVVSVGYQFALRTGAGPGASGQCITRLEIAPTNVDIASGWTVDMTVVFQNPGEYSESGAVFAVLPAQLQLVVETQIKRDQTTKLHLAFPQGVMIP